MKAVAILFICCILFVGCTKNKTVAPDTRTATEKLLNGRWYLFQTIDTIEEYYNVVITKDTMYYDSIYLAKAVIQKGFDSTWLIQFGGKGEYGDSSSFNFYDGVGFYLGHTYQDAPGGYALLKWKYRPNSNQLYFNNDTTLKYEIEKVDSNDFVAVNITKSIKGFERYYWHFKRIY